MTSKRLGFTGVFEGERLLGVITDGDLRRRLGSDPGFLSRSAAETMHGQPKTVGSGVLAVEALRTMERHAITSLFVVDGQNPSKVRGVIHIHDLVKAGLR